MRMDQNGIRGNQSCHIVIWCHINAKHICDTLEPLTDGACHIVIFCHMVFLFPPFLKRKTGLGYDSMTLRDGRGLTGVIPAVI